MIREVKFERNLKARIAVSNRSLLLSTRTVSKI